MLIIGATEHPLNYHFERGKELEYWTLGYLQCGRIRTRTAQGQYIRESGSISLIAPHTSYALKWAGREGIWSEIYCIFAPLPQWNSLLSWPIEEHGFGILNIGDATMRLDIEEALCEGMCVLRSAKPRKTELAFNLVERVLLLLDEINPLRGYPQLDSRIGQALEFITRHFAENLNLEILARHVCLSPSHFAHLFSAQMNVSPMQYIEEYRVERAAEKLLSTNQTIAQIARECGFTNAFHFSTRFRKRLGKSPKGYRESPH